jgi:hypothetical protein
MKLETVKTKNSLVKYEILGNGNIVVRKVVGGNPIAVDKELRELGFIPWLSANTKFSSK